MSCPSWFYASSVSSVMRTYWNDDEDMALQGLRPATQVMYLRGIRRFMDFSNGFVGIKRKISYTSLSECCEFIPESRSREKPDRKSKSAVRAALSELERAGLIIKKSSETLIFFLPLADMDYSVFNLNDTSATHERPPISDTPKHRYDVDLSVVERHTEQIENMRLSDTHPLSDNRLLKEDIYLDTVTKEKKTPTKTFSKPTIQEITEFIREKKYTVDADVFFNHYESNGWIVGKTKMKCWKSALANWNSREKKQVNKNAKYRVSYEQLTSTDF